MSISPADLSAQRNAALQQFRDQTKQVENSLVKEITTSHANDLREGSTDSAQIGSDDKAPSWESQAKAVQTVDDLMKANPGLSLAQYKELLAKTGAEQTLQEGAGMAPAGGGAGGGAPVGAVGGGGGAPAGAVGGPAGGAAAGPAQQPISFATGGVGSQLLPDASAAHPPGSGAGAGSGPAPAGGAPAPGGPAGPAGPGGPPNSVPADNAPLQIAQQVQQMHSMWDQIRSIEAQMDVDDRKTQMDIANMYAAQWQAQMQSSQSNMLAMMAASHGFVAAFIKNFVSA